MAVSVIIPEGIIICAFGQWREARVLHTAWRAKYGRPKKTWAEKLRLWGSLDDGFGIDGAFFVVMGGFVVDLPREPEIRPGVIDRAPEHSVGDNHNSITTTITASGFLVYLDQGYIHDRTFDRESITDKNKTNNIAKLIASSQALWLVAQCITRFASSLPLTLLEIHVGIQVLCTLILYTLWWSKPLDVNVPIKIVLRKKFSDLRSDDVPNLAAEELVHEENKSDQQLLKQSPRALHFITRRTPSGLTAVTARALYDIIRYILEQPAGIGGDEPGCGTGSIVLEGLLIIINGILHATAWNVHFPSTLECWLWRGTSIYMCIFPFLIVWLQTTPLDYCDLRVVIWKFQLKKRTLFRCFCDSVRGVHYMCDRNFTRNHHHARVMWFGIYYLHILSFLLLIMIYTLSIIIITVEMYFSLRDLPQGAFDTPVWSDYWPHL